MGDYSLTEGTNVLYSGKKCGVSLLNFSDILSYFRKHMKKPQKNRE